MEKKKRKILRQAKAHFSPTEYKRYFRALKTLELHTVNLDKTIVIQLKLFEVMPEFSLAYTSLFQGYEDISESLLNRFLNTEHKAILENIKKLRSIHLLSSTREKELLHFLFEAFVKDSKIIYFFLADQYALSKTIHTHSLDSQLAYASSIFSITSPLAKRMGIRTLRETFENIGFSILFPEDYQNVLAQRTGYIQKEKMFMRKISDKIRYFLKKEGLSFHIASRIKSLYSIYKKLKKKGRRDISSLNDIFALRIIVPEVEDCYRVFGILHSHFSHVPGKIKDYISLPKPNAYQSLHTILEIEIENKTLPFEIQIRTTEMNTVATSGMAAHLFYKTGNISGENQKQVKKKVKSLSHHFSAQTFLQNAEEDLFSRYIFIFTPDNHIFPLEKGATALDFAFLIHSSIGQHCTSALVNGDKMSIDTVLQNGEKVEILTSEHKTIQEKWLTIARVPSVQKQIRTYFDK